MSGTGIGGWLIARLLAETADPERPPPDYDDFAELVSARIDRALRADSPDGTRVLSLIAAAGDRPVLPIQLLAAAVGDEDNHLPIPRIRDQVVEMGGAYQPW